ncbi:MAG: hypothetical protein FJ215_06935 [Ignavibacteria bacterium]|nr:hypothetical protein [Ignavibacteria bacterium]
MIFRSLFVTLVLLALHSPANGQSKKLKVYISVDMEGISGVVTDDQLSPSGFEYERYREVMTREALAAVRAAKEAGATEILVSDSHGNGENLIVDMFPKEVRVIRSWPRRLSMMAGIDSTFDAVIFIGYHSSIHNQRGVRAHTFSSARIARIAINGVEMTEGAWNAAIAGYFGVPVVMVSGDEYAITELQQAVGNIEGAEVKKSLGYHSANTLTAEAAAELIYQKARKGLERRKDFRPYVVRTPVTLDLTFKHYRPAEVLAYLKFIERTGTHSIRYLGKDMLEIADFMVFLSNYSIGLEP